MICQNTKYGSLSTERIRNGIVNSLRNSVLDRPDATINDCDNLGDIFSRAPEDVLSLRKNAVLAGFAGFIEGTYGIPINEIACHNPDELTVRGATNLIYRRVLR